MSSTDTSIALMVNNHALWAVRLKLFLARAAMRWDRVDVLVEHKKIIERRATRLGEGARSKAKPEQAEALPFPEAV